MSPQLVVNSSRPAFHLSEQKTAALFMHAGCVSKYGTVFLHWLFLLLAAECQSHFKRTSARYEYFKNYKTQDFLRIGEHLQITAPRCVVRKYV